MKTREKIAKFMCRPLIIMIIIISSLTLSILAQGIGTLFGFAMVLITLWAIKWDWKYFGIQRNSFFMTVLKAFVFTIFIVIANDFLFQPLIEHFFGETDLSALEGLKGNFINYILFILMMWVVAAFGEEIFYRGYVTKRIAVILGNSKKGWIAGIVISSIIFGFAHLYQGGSGVITTGFIALIFGAIFYNNQQNLWVGIVTHGFYDVFGITMIYYGQERLISNWAIENIYFFL